MRGHDEDTAHRVGGSRGRGGQVQVSGAPRRRWALLFLLGAALALLVGTLGPPASAGTKTFQVRPGSWLSTGIHLTKGENFTVSASGSLHYPNTSQTWGPDGYYNLGFYAYNLKGRFGAGNNTLFDIGVGGPPYFAPIDGVLQLGITRTYETIGPNDGSIQGSFTAQVTTTPATPSSPSQPTTSAAPPTTTALAALDVALACDTGSLQDSGQVTCAAAVAHQANNAHITYLWTVDGQAQPGVTGSVLSLDNVATGGHQVSVIADDDANNLQTSPRTASFTRAAAVPGGPPGAAPPTTETGPPSASTETAPPPTLGAGPGTATAPPTPAPVAAWSACHLAIGLGAGPAPTQCPVPMAAVVSGGGAALAAALALLAALLLRRHRPRRPPSPTGKDDSWQPQNAGECGDRLTDLDQQLNRALTEARQAIDDRNDVANDKRKFDVEALEIQGAAAALRWQIAHYDAQVVAAGTNMLLGTGFFSALAALIGSIGTTLTTAVAWGIRGWRGALFAQKIYNNYQGLEIANVGGHSVRIPYRQLPKLRQLGLDAVQYANSLADAVNTAAKTFDDDLAQRATDIDTLTQRATALFDQREATYQHCQSGGNLPPGTWHRPRPLFHPGDDGAIRDIEE